MLIATVSVQQAWMNKPHARLCRTPTASETLERVRRDSAHANEHLAEYLAECLAAIDKYEATVKAFASIDPDAFVKPGSEGLLRGIPIGVKDVIETADLPTEYNSPLYAGHHTDRDAACISILKSHGAVILGKTTTVEFASLGRVTQTRNPHNPDHTPGGSSSGSGAAVATGMVPIALGTQTGGSTVRPASFCGVAALKPTYGLVPTEGLKPYAPSLDTITWMARSADDLELMLRCFQPLEQPPEMPGTLRVGVYRTPYWDQAEGATRNAVRDCAELLAANGIAVEPVDVLSDERELNSAQDTLMHAEGRLAYLAEYLEWGDDLSPALRAEVENAKAITPLQLAAAYDYLGTMRPKMEARMAGFDAWLTPAVPGEAPAGLDSTGDAVFNRLWTGLHMPCVALPGYAGPLGLPVGIQLVAPRYRDLELLGVARVVEALINAR